MILEQTLQGNYSFWGQILQRNYIYSQPTSWSWDTRQLQSWSWSWDKHYKAITVSWTNIKRQLLSKSTTVMLMGHALQLQSTHVMILGHIYCMAVSQPIVMILGHTHYRQLVNPCHNPGTHITRHLQWHTHYKAITINPWHDPGTHITRQLQWHIYYKATTVNPCHDPGMHAFQGNYSHSCKPLIHWLDSDLLAVRSPALSACRSLACTSCDVKGTNMPMPPDSVV